MPTRFDRNIQFFGEEGQLRLRRTHVTIVGIGGLGTHIVQQLAFLGVGGITLIDDEALDQSNRNRYIGSQSDDPIPGISKTSIGKRLIRSIDPDIKVTEVADNFVTEQGYSAVTMADYVFGCLDNEGSRMILTELCAAYKRPYFDLASEILSGDKARYGGRVCFSNNAQGCLLCLGELDVADASSDIAGADAKKERDAIYGVDRKQLGAAGPSVVTLNGVVASIAATEFMVEVTGVRRALPLIKYYGHLGKVTIAADPPKPDCYICTVQRGRRDEADVQHYIRDGCGKRRT